MKPGSEWDRAWEGQKQGEEKIPLVDRMPIKCVKQEELQESEKEGMEASNKTKDASESSSSKSKAMLLHRHSGITSGKKQIHMTWLQIWPRKGLRLLGPDV